MIMTTDIETSRQNDKQMVRAEVHQPQLCHFPCLASNTLVNEMTCYIFEGGTCAFGGRESEYRGAPSNTGG